MSLSYPTATPEQKAILCYIMDLALSCESMREFMKRKDRLYIRYIEGIPTVFEALEGDILRPLEP